MCPPRAREARYLGIGSLMIAVVTAIMVALVALSVTHINQAAYSGLSGNKTALQAQEYALTKAEFIRAVNYDDLTAQSRSLISNSVNFYDEVIIGDETDYPDGNDIKQRIATINVYKDAEILPRYSLRVTRLSANQSGGTGVPTGTVLPWYGQLADIPSGFALCNGSNGTPDLRNRFIVGAGSTYALGATGGANTVVLDSNTMPKHYHYHGYNYSSNGGMWPRLATTVTSPYPTGTIATKWNGSGGGNWNGWDSGNSSYLLSNLVTTFPFVDSSATTSGHENRPPYYALYYIMKL